MAFKKTKFLTVLAICFASVVALGAVVYASMFVASHADNIYILDRGASYSASLAEGVTVEQRRMEVEDHVSRFHELLFNLAPSDDQINSSIEMALRMCDRSGYEYFNDQQEGGYYSRLVSANISQYIKKDSIQINMSVYPYQVAYYGKRYVLRESNMTQYAFKSVGQLVNQERSKSNPHGLMLERFKVTINNEISTRRRR